MRSTLLRAQDSSECCGPVPALPGPGLGNPCGQMGVQPWMFGPFASFLALPGRGGPAGGRAGAALCAGGSTRGVRTPFPLWAEEGPSPTAPAVRLARGQPCLGPCSIQRPPSGARTGRSSPRGAKAVPAPARPPGPPWLSRLSSGVGSDVPRAGVRSPSLQAFKERPRAALGVMAGPARWCRVAGWTG